MVMGYMLTVGMCSSVPVIAHGTLTGDLAIDYRSDSMVQTLTVDGATWALTKGDGWPDAGELVDVVLFVTLANEGAVTWTVVDATLGWAGGTAPSGDGLWQVVLRCCNGEIYGIACQMEAAS